MIQLVSKATATSACRTISEHSQALGNWPANEVKHIPTVCWSYHCRGSNYGNKFCAVLHRDCMASYYSRTFEWNDQALAWELHWYLGHFLRKQSATVFLKGAVYSVCLFYFSWNHLLPISSPTIWLEGPRYDSIRYDTIRFTVMTIQSHTPSVHAYLRVCACACMCVRARACVNALMCWLSTV